MCRPRRAVLRTHLSAPGHPDTRIAADAAHLKLLAHPQVPSVCSESVSSARSTQVDLEIATSGLPHSLRHTYFAPGSAWNLAVSHRVRLCNGRPPLECR